jgi:hypothetical protein
MSDIKGNSKQLWDYMQLYLQGAARMGKLTNATDLCNVVGMAICFAAQADPDWLRESCWDAYRQSGCDWTAYQALIEESRQNIRQVTRYQPLPGELDDIAAAAIRKAGLN